jgi:hypothetical protein
MVKYIARGQPYDAKPSSLRFIFLLVPYCTSYYGAHELHTALTNAGARLITR